MGLFDSLFSKPQAPLMPTLDYNQTLTNGAQTNMNILNQYGSQMTDFMQNLFNQTNPNVQNALNINYQTGNQLATQGYTSAMGDYMKLLQQQSLEAGAASGIPIGSAYTANLASGLGAQQLLQNQLQGNNLLAQNASQQSALGQYFMNPIMGSLGTAGTALQAGMYNNQIQGQNAMIQAQNSQANSFFGNLLNNTLGGLMTLPAQAIGATTNNALTGNLGSNSNQGVMGLLRLVGYA